MKLTVPFAIVFIGFSGIVFCGCFRSEQTREHAHLVSAVESGDLQKVKEFSKDEKVINSEDDFGRHLTPLMWAAKCEQREILDYLLSKGADVHKRNADGETALHIAIYGGDSNADIVESLIKHGADLNAKDKLGANVLAYAEAHSPPAPNIVEILKRAGTSNGISKDRETAK